MTDTQSPPLQPVASIVADQPVHARTTLGFMQSTFIDQPVSKPLFEPLFATNFHHPRKLDQEAFCPIAYRIMYLSRRLESRILELFRKGYIKGTVTISIGNEGVTVGAAMPFRPGADVISLLHRDFASHLLLGTSPRELLCQYLANAESPTHGREGNVHHGDVLGRRFPMISHLGKMLSTVVGGTWAARQDGEKIFGLAVIGDGGTSTGEFHEALNLASVLKIPVLFLVENNQYSFSTHAKHQYNCRRLSDRAVGYGISGRTIDGTDAWEVYQNVLDAMDAMQADPAPMLLECMSTRLHGHAAYDQAEYISQEDREAIRRRDPMPRMRQALARECGLDEQSIAMIENEVDEQIERTVRETLPIPRPDPMSCPIRVLAESSPRVVEPFRARRAKNGTAVNRALDYILRNNPRAFLAGLDVGTYGSAFKTCKGLIDSHGPDRVIDMPLCESAIVGFGLGASQVGAQPIIEFQFADFSTEVVTQLGLNAGTWFFRTGYPVPMLLRLPCGGGLTMGAFHSDEYEGLWARFPGLKLLYPATAQETFEALVAGFHDPNPCLVFEHKLLYWSEAGDIDFDGNLAAVWRSRQYTEGSDLTLVATGAMVREAMAASAGFDGRIEIFNPFVLAPLDLEPILASVEKTGRLMVVQECGHTRGLGDRIISRVVRQCLDVLKCPPLLIAAPDVPVPFASELEARHRPDRQKIIASIEQMLPEN